MIDRLRISALRLMVEAAVAVSWAGKKNRQVTTRREQIASDNHSIDLRLYFPAGNDAPKPAILFFHGGGWVGFSTRTHDALCRDLCARADAIVVSVEYRLAPEYPFPAGVNDCLAALHWFAENATSLGADRKQLFVCGDSAGGNLAAVIAQQARSLHPGLLAGQILIYPVTDHYTSDWPSYTAKGKKGATLTTESMTELWDWYTQNSPEWRVDQPGHELATPLRVTDLSGLPNTLVLLAEEDLLHDDGAEYAKRLEQAGNQVDSIHYSGEQHGFLGLKPTASHHGALEDIANWIGKQVRL